MVKRDAFPVAKCYYLWLEHLLNALIYTQDKQRVLIDYDLFLAQPQQELQRLAQALDLTVSPELSNQFLATFLDENLRHYSKKSTVDADNLPYANELYNYLIDANLNPNPNPAELDLLIAKGNALLDGVEFSFSSIDSLTDRIKILSLENLQLTKSLHQKNEQIQSSMNAFNWYLLKACNRFTQLSKRLGDVIRKKIYPENIN